MNRWRTGAAELARSVFALTPGERQAVCLVLALALLGLGVKAWHAGHQPPYPASTTRTPEQSP